MALNSFDQTLSAALAIDLESEVGSGKERLINGNTVPCDLHLMELQDSDPPEWVGINTEYYRFICSASRWPCDKPAPGGWDAPGTEIEIDYEKYYVWHVDSYEPELNMVLVRTSI